MKQTCYCWRAGPRETLPTRNNDALLLDVLDLLGGPAPPHLAGGDGEDDDLVVVPHQLGAAVPEGLQRLKSMQVEEGGDVDHFKVHVGCS